ncbi:MAG: hypothetical protein ACRYFK_03535 [Janthinobacterium lividum]
MPQSLPLPRRPLPTLLLLGLLALLLWGQCGLRIGGGRPALPTDLMVVVKSTDRLVAASTARPAALYLTLDVYNSTPLPVVLHGAQGQLVYRGQQWPWTYEPASAANRPAVPAQGHQLLPLTIAITPPDSVAALRASLHTASYLPLLTMEVVYSRSNKAEDPPRHLQTSSYLELLPAP